MDEKRKEGNEMSANKVHPQAKMERKPSIIATLFKGIAGTPKAQHSESKKTLDKNGAANRKQSSSIILSTATGGTEEAEKVTNFKGELFFWRNFSYDIEGIPFFRVNHDSQMNEVGTVLTQEWKLSVPRIVLVVISNVAPLREWSNSKQLKSFQKGLIDAVNTTDMWVLTNGMNIGITKMIGEAVQEELQRRMSKGCPKHQNQSKQPRIVVIGVPREDLLNHADNVDGRTQRVEVENEGNRLEDLKFDLNPDHSHFVVVRDGTISKTGINYFLLRLEQYLVHTLEHPRKSADPKRIKCTLGYSEIPVVALLVQGGTDCARLVLDHLKKHLPLVVLKGSGGLADILGFAFNEITQRPQGIADAEFSESYLKPELSRKITEKFPKLRDNSLARNIFRDRIIDCVRFAKQNEQVYLTILNIYEHNCNLENLGNYLLRALFKSQKTDQSSWHEQMKKDLYLTLDWNSPNVATSEVFLKDPSSKFKIEKDIFEEALLRPNRESFVDLFISQGFQVHKYLTPRRLIFLFRKVQDQEFFQSVCWEGALGYGPMSKITREFIDTDLNWLIEKTSGLSNIVTSQELSLNAMGMYINDPAAAERKAKVLLTFWASFTNQIPLCKILWRHSEHPIHLALILSMMIERLTIYVNDTTLRTEMETSSRDFAEIATSMLDACYEDVPCRAFDVLNEESSEWGYNTAVDIAAQANNRRFLSHICCQKWLTSEFYGSIRIRDLSWGIFSMPTGAKILLCAFFIFPMYAWIRFSDDQYHMMDEDKDPQEADSDDEKDNVVLIRNNTADPDSANGRLKGTESSGKAVLWKTRSLRRYVTAHPPLWKMIYLMWSAPMTKFWTFQMFYVVYLTLFSMAVMWPSCGNDVLDTVVCCWTVLIALESVHPAFQMRRKYKRMAFLLKLCEIFSMLIFAALYALGRIFRIGFLDPYSTRVILCCGLLYFYYRIIIIYLPISPTLGPLLYRMKLMVLVDFMNFMRMTILVIISGGIVIHAVMYPDYPFNKELFRRTFHKAWFSLFMTPIHDLGGNDECSALAERPYNQTHCWAGEYEDARCVTVGLWSYLFNIQYFVLLKLILLTLLYALFSATATKLAAESDAIWKFQRYHLVVDFSNRLRLPAPINVISYIIIIGQLFYWLVKCLFCSGCKWGKKKEVSKDKNRRIANKDYAYWNQLAHEYITKEDSQHKEVDLLERQMTMVEGLIEDFVYQKQMLLGLKGSVRELERLMNYAHVHLENIRHLTTRDSARSTGWDDSNNRVGQAVMNILSRRSPYPKTRVLRFPVPDKYVPWEVMWISYDPVSFTQPRSDFPVALQAYVDEDILMLREKQGSQQALPVFAWNSISINPAGIGLDRQSWITTPDGSPLTYKLDSEEVPQNPMGRTGLRGRGSLPRWGPNHFVHIIITRFQKGRDTLLSSKGLEFVVMWTEKRFQLTLPGGFVAGEDRYDIIRSMFKPQVTGNTVWDDPELVINFFRECAVTKAPPPADTEKLKEVEDKRDKVHCEVVLIGYLDDPMNTDQAWKETELWHVHYDTTEKIANLLQPMMGWRLITEDAFFKLPEGQAALLQDIARKMKATIL